MLNIQNVLIEDEYNWATDEIEADTKDLANDTPIQDIIDDTEFVQWLSGFCGVSLAELSKDGIRKAFYTYLTIEQ